MLNENHLSARKKVFEALCYRKESVYLNVLLWAELINLNSGLASSNYSVINASDYAFMPVRHSLPNLHLFKGISVWK